MADQLICPDCGKSEWDLNEYTETYCIGCGYIFHTSNNLTTSVSFDDHGGVVQCGEFVNFDTGQGMNSRKSSTEQTLEKAKRRIREIASALKGLDSIHVERATRFYKIALLEHHFSTGRKRDHVLSACLYLVCRLEKKPHMLIDFSDVLPTDKEGVPVKVHKLGQTFVELSNVLKIEKLPLVDPSLYLDRFAQQLEFGNKTQQVTQTALRFIQRMNRDWIQTGRRPAGVCGAALMMAARVHGFNRTPEDIVNIVRIGDKTLQKRIIEFIKTPSVNLTPLQFQTMDIHTDTLPPCFKTEVKCKEENEDEDDESERKGKKKRKKHGSTNEKTKGKGKKSRKKSKYKESTEEEVVDKKPKKIKKQKVQNSKESETSQQNTKKRKRDASSILLELQEAAKRRHVVVEEDKSVLANLLDEEENNTIPAGEVQIDMFSVLEKVHNELIEHPSTSTNTSTNLVDSQNDTAGAEEYTDNGQEKNVQIASTLIKGELAILAKKKKEKPLLNSNLQNIPEPDAPVLGIKEKSYDEEDVANFSDVDDAEIDCYILSERDVQTKSKLWYHFNKDYLREQEEKAKAKEEQLLKPKIRKPRKKRTPAASATEATEQIFKKSNPKSTLINWDAYNTLFQKLEGGGFEDFGNTGDGGVVLEEEENEKAIFEQETLHIKEEEQQFGLSSEEDDDPLEFL